MESHVTIPQTWAIEVKGLTKFFGSHPVLNEINLEVSEGEFVVIFGPNGAGKPYRL
jgi:ABC-type multidrug transport system ATPase subunit